MVDFNLQDQTVSPPNCFRAWSFIMVTESKLGCPPGKGGSCKVGGGQVTIPAVDLLLQSVQVAVGLWKSHPGGHVWEVPGGMQMAETLAGWIVMGIFTAGWCLGTP